MGEWRTRKDQGNGEFASQGDSRVRYLYAGAGRDRYMRVMYRSGTVHVHVGNVDTR